MPKISVIVPVYKVEQYLDKCVKSVLEQTFEDFELILVDDGSPDNCPKICDDWAGKDARIRVIHQKNGGLSAARNAGIDWAFENSDSEWINFIDSDDWVHPRYLEVLYNTAKKNNAEISICGFYRTEGEEAVIPAGDFDSSSWAPEDYFCSHNVNAVIAVAKLYKKGLFKEIRYPIGKLHEDEFTTYKLIFGVEKLAVVPAQMYFYYQNQQSIMGSKQSLNRTDSFDALEEQIAYFDANGFVKARAVIENLYIHALLFRINSLKQNPEADKTVLRVMYRKKRINAKRYARNLNPNDPKDEFILAKLYPFEMKVYIYFRAALRKLRIIK